MTTESLNLTHYWLHQILDSGEYLHSPTVIIYAMFTFNDLYTHIVRESHGALTSLCLDVISLRDLKVSYATKSPLPPSRPKFRQCYKILKSQSPSKTNTQS